MWKNNWKIALRHILKNKTSSAINISGLAIGMAACLLILQFVSFELSYDQFHQNNDRIFRVVNDRYQNGRLVQHGTITYSGVARAMKEDFPEEVETYSRMEPFRSLLFMYGDKKTDEAGLAVDNSFLSIFSFPLLAGDRVNALSQPNMVMLSAAWWVMNNWLSGFAYRIDLAWWFFAAAGLLALLIAMATISFHAIRSALSNPVNSLRTE